MKKKLYILLMLICMLSVQLVQAQQKKPKKKPKGATTNTSYTARIKHKDEPTAPKEYMHIYRTNTRGILMGNKCMDDYTEKMGFRYVMMPADQDGSLTDTQMRLNNFGVKFILLITKGPFWHHRLNKRSRKCREKTGDFYGLNTAL